MRASVVSYVAFALSLLFPRLSFLWCLGSVVLHDLCISWVSSLTFFACSLSPKATLYILIQTGNVHFILNKTKQDLGEVTSNDSCSLKAS